MLAFRIYKASFDVGPFRAIGNIGGRTIVVGYDTSRTCGVTFHENPLLTLLHGFDPLFHNTVTFRKLLFIQGVREAALLPPVDKLRAKVQLPEIFLQNLYKYALSLSHNLINYKNDIYETARQYNHGIDLGHARNGGGREISGPNGNTVRD